MNKIIQMSVLRFRPRAVQVMLPLRGFARSRKPIPALQPRERMNAEDLDKLVAAELENYQRVFGGTELDKLLDNLIDQKLAEGKDEQALLEELATKLSQTGEGDLDDGLVDHRVQAEFTRLMEQLNDPANYSEGAKHF